MKTLAPWPAPGESRAPFRGVLAMSDDELADFVRDNKIEFPAPTPESEAAAQEEAEIFAAIARATPGRKKTPAKPTKAGRSSDAIRKIEFWLDLLLPPGRASDALLDLEDVYGRRWLPKYGVRSARSIFAVQGAGIIWSFHSQRLTKWICGGLGLIKLSGWFSGPRGG